MILRAPISDRVIIQLALAVFILSSLYHFAVTSMAYSQETPTSGGTLIEGIVGTPRYVNPVLAFTRADQDVAALVYSGLMKINEHGELVPDVAESITVSEDGRTYVIQIREGVTFHDDSPLTARDVAYTIALIQNPNLRSPLRASWSGVLVEERGEYELAVVLEEPYTPFIENFTFGILPRHKWDNLPIEQLPFSQYNTNPIGSGPYKVASIAHNNLGLINQYLLQRADTTNSANLEYIQLQFYADSSDVETALLAGEIHGTPSLSSEQIAAILATHGDELTVIEASLPRTFALFLNQNRSAALRDIEVRRALALAIDRDTLIETAVGGYGVPITGPLPNNTDALEWANNSTTTTALDEAGRILDQADWVIAEDAAVRTRETDDGTETLAVTIRTENSPLFELIAESVATNWRELGVEVTIEQYEQPDLLQSIVRPRDFQALLYGVDLGRQVDLYPFWHSSQKDDPGLNIAQYTNIEVDTLLETIRTEADDLIRASTTGQIADIITAEQPAIFLFSPTFTYVIDRNVYVAPISNITKPHERFMNIATWHADTDSVWPWFTKYLD